MLSALDHVVIAVKDLEAATRSVGHLLGRSPSWQGEHPGLGTANTLFRLANTSVELLAAAGTGPGAVALGQHIERRGEGLVALAFATPDVAALVAGLRGKGVTAPHPAEEEARERDTGAVRRWRRVALPLEGTRGVLVFAIERLAESAELPLAVATSAEEGCVTALDHVVVQSRELDASRALYGDRLGLRLALDREFPERGLRLIFFRVGGVTVELAGALKAGDEAGEPDRLYGLSYRVPDVDAAVVRLAQDGFDVSKVREGMKPGTRVATVHSAPFGVPTLLLGPADPAA